MYFKSLLVLVLVLFLSACSSDSGSGTPATVTGHFIDDGVKGLGYKCSSSDTLLVTDAVGAYTCNVGDDVTFFINGVSIDTSVSAQEVSISPYTLFPNDNDAALNLAMLLQSINTGNIVNIIEIDTALEVKIPLSTDFTSPSFVTTMENALGITLIDPFTAQSNMNDAIIADGGTIPENLNHIPVANAGIDQNVVTSFAVTLNGNGSSDADADTLTYSWSLVTKPSSSTTTLINQSSVTPTFTPDLDGEYILELRVNDGIYTSAADTIKVTATSSENVPRLSASSGSVAENAIAGTSVGNITITSIGSSAITAITLSGTGSDNFVVSTVGAITVSSSASLNYDTEPSYSLNAIATNAVGNSSAVTVTITVTDTSTVIPTLANSTGSVDENATVGTFVGNIIISNSGDSNITAITLSGTGSDNFEVSNSGAITVKSGAILDFETAPTYSLGVIATNAAGDSPSVTLSISVIDVTEGNVPILLASSASVSESAAVGTTVGNVSISSIGDSAITAITLSGTGSENFDVATSGVISVKSGATLDYETTQTYNLTARATNSQGTSSAVAVTISVLNTVEVPILATSTGSVAEDAATGASVGNISITTPGDSPILAITLSGTGNTNFEVDADGIITLKAGASLDYETDQSYSLTAIAQNSAGNSNSVSVIISIGDILDTATFYIKSAVYDNRATTTVTDDKLYIYFDQSIDSATVDANMTNNYDINGTGAIGSLSISTYVDADFHQHILALNDTGTASTSFVTNSTKISITAGVLRDPLGHPTIYDANQSTVEKFKVMLKSGQTTSYPSNTVSDRDDGFYESGQTRSYTDNTDGTITDNVTGLIWQTEDDNTTKTWSDASSYCSALVLGGNSNWRLPTAEELISLADYGTLNPSINALFTNTNPYHYWTSTTFHGDNTNAHTVKFSEGELSFVPKTSSIYIRCVRTGI